MRRLCSILASVLCGCAAASAASARHGPVLVQARWVGSLGILGEFVTVYAEGTLIHRVGRYLYEKAVEERRLSAEELSDLRQELRDSDTISLMMHRRIGPGRRDSMEGGHVERSPFERAERALPGALGVDREA